MTSSNMVSIIEDIVAAGKAYEGNRAGSRETLIDLSYALAGKLEIPSEFLQRTFWAEPAKSANCRTAVRLNIFQHLKDAGDEGLSDEDLAKKTGVGIDLHLLQRLMRHLAVFHVVSFTKGKWCATALSNGLAEQNYQRSIEFCYDSGMPSFYKFPEYFKNNGYNLPKSDTDGPFQYAHKSQISFFPWIEANPPNLANFATFMSAYRAGKPNWFDPGFYPVNERLIEGFDASYSEVLLVDVGGGRGHDMVHLSAQYPSLPGKLVLQDQEPVIASIGIQDPPFEAQVHDFYTPQPIKARAYALHSVLHDWGDEQGVQILENLKPALKTGYSRVLLFEIVVSEDQPSRAATTMDMQMLAHVSVGERTEKDWRDIIERRAGLKITNIYIYPGVAESLIEAELPGSGT